MTDKVKVCEQAIEAVSGVTKSVQRQIDRCAHRMEELSQEHDDLMKIQGYVRREMAEWVERKRKVMEGLE